MPTSRDARAGLVTARPIISLAANRRSPSRPDLNDVCLQEGDFSLSGTWRKRLRASRRSIGITRPTAGLLESSLRNTWTTERFFRKCWNFVWRSAIEAPIDRRRGGYPRMVSLIEGLDKLLESCG